MTRSGIRVRKDLHSTEKEKGDEPNHRAREARVDVGLTTSGEVDLREESVRLKKRCESSRKLCFPG